MGAPDANINSQPKQGAVYVFTPNSSYNWTQRAKLTASDSTAWQRFGSAVAHEDDTLLSGTAELGITSRDDAVYVFTGSDSEWIQEAKLKPSDNISTTNRFGAAVAIDAENGNTTLFIGAPHATISGKFSAGVAYVFAYSDFQVWKKGFAVTFGGIQVNTCDFGAVAPEMTGTPMTFTLLLNDSDDLFFGLPQVQISGEYADEFSVIQSPTASVTRRRTRQTLCSRLRRADQARGWPRSRSSLTTARNRSIPLR